VEDSGQWGPSPLRALDVIPEQVVQPPDG
jgi:hypothetical protein